MRGEREWFGDVLLFTHHPQVPLPPPDDDEKVKDIVKCTCMCLLVAFTAC